MTNEELAVKAKTGDSNVLLELWEQVHRLAFVIARHRYDRLKASGNTCGADMDDLMQASFLALVDAVGYYDESKDFSFTTYFGKCLQRQYNELLGFRTRKRDPLNSCTSLDTPLDDSPDAETLESLVPDPTDAYEAATEKMWQDELKASMEKALSKLSPEQAKVLKMRYYDELTYNEIQEKAGLSSRFKARTIEASALRELRKSKNRSELEQFVDLETNFYFGGSVARQESPVEIMAEKREHLREKYKPSFDLPEYLRFV